MLGHAVHYLYCRYAHRADPAQQVDDPLLVVGKAVGVELFTDGRVPGLPLLVLVQHPLQGGAVPQPVRPLPSLAPRTASSARPALSSPGTCRPAGWPGVDQSPLGHDVPWERGRLTRIQYASPAASGPSRPSGGSPGTGAGVGTPAAGPRRIRAGRWDHGAPRRYRRKSPRR